MHGAVATAVNRHLAHSSLPIHILRSKAKQNKTLTHLISTRVGNSLTHSLRLPFHSDLQIFPRSRQLLHFLRVAVACMACLLPLRLPLSAPNPHHGSRIRDRHSANSSVCIPGKTFRTISRRHCQGKIQTGVGASARKSPVVASAAAPHQDATRERTMPGGEQKKTMKIVGVFYKAHEYAKDPKFLGCAENALGLREFLESEGHTYIVTDDKEGDQCELEKHIPDMEVLITTPFHPAYMDADRLKKAQKLKLILTAGVGSDHIDLHAAADKGMTVAEVSGSNVVSVAEDELMRILLLVRNFLPAHKQVSDGGWNVAAVAYRAFDLQGKTVGTVGSGRIGQELLKRLKAFDCKLLYYARHSMGEELEKATGATWESDLDKFLAACDVVSINLPLSDKTRAMFNKDVINKMKKGAMLVNNARGAIVDVDAVKEACESGQLGGYSGDVWYPQPPPEDHSWRHMPNQAMTPHISGTTIDAQERYAHGVREMLEQYFAGKPLPEENYIVREGELAPQYQ